MYWPFSFWSYQPLLRSPLTTRMLPVWRTTPLVLLCTITASCYPFLHCRRHSRSSVKERGKKRVVSPLVRCFRFVGVSSIAIVQLHHDFGVVIVDGGWESHDGCGESRDGSWESGDFFCEIVWKLVDSLLVDWVWVSLPFLCHFRWYCCSVALTTSIPSL